MELSVETRARATRVVERRGARAGERSRARDADEGAVHGPTGKRAAHGVVLLGGEQQRQRRRALAQVDARDLAGLETVAGAVEDVVRDLEGDAEREPEAAEGRVAAVRTEQARSLEQLRRLQCAALEVALDRRIRVVGLAPLEGLAACQAKGRLGERRDRPRVARGGKLREGPREEVVAGGARRLGPVGGPRGGPSTPEPGPVDEIVVDERRHVNQLDGDPGGQRRRQAPLRRQEHQHRPQSLPTGRERIRADCGADAGMARDGLLQPLLELVEIALEPGRIADRGESGHVRVPVCSATMPPANVRYATCSNPACSSSAASSAGGGKRRTLAGRYVYAEPPFSALPRSGTIRSNQSR